MPIERSWVARRRRRLTFHARQSRGDATPARCLRSPDCHGRLGDLRVIERTGADEYEMRARLCAAEHGCAAARAKQSMHDVAAVGDIRIVTSYPVDGEILGFEASIDRTAPSAQVLAQAAPANAGN